MCANAQRKRVALPEGCRLHVEDEDGEALGCTSASYAKSSANCFSKLALFSKKERRCSEVVTRKRTADAAFIVPYSLPQSSSASTCAPVVWETPLFRCGSL